MLRLQQQLKLLNHVYGAACDNQYLLTTMPQYAKRMTISRRMSDETNWHMLDAELLRSLVGGSALACNGVIPLPMDRLRRKARARTKRCTGCGQIMEKHNDTTKSSSLLAKSDDEDHVCEECRSPMHAPPIHPGMRKRKDKRKAPHPTPVPTQTNRKPETGEPSILDWRDPLTTRVQLANPPEETDADFQGHNISTT
ncbi:uncharacterized protein LOC111351434 isoform X1 [Spodoptera litura]|uniref:Uncharacterized protein LOC111351434 isoform X1 n=1 Tax=Spodoptera litura TaxID=69820 RepID=A0A9J7DZI2_SPOLT|nr:uncharacterized protein LOC111351434 isoform X1 [Spodoptera litura]